ncbi:outer membrane protein insertion porin family [Caulobacter ginsengisoli]|uniref:Outer membrane protein assembly factor BamA n=1 Tax=Caulobacter ginsengisoli TaxID=400775 RepID=A0ABU0ILZ0_9CAUL|nr:outer membrane protein assembly factor BamA [Caulobacter ginsengisoli]MDQ0463025.1 outer membrane protein insertion porin family [Caulobacter ginsengisoli]
MKHSRAYGAAFVSGLALLLGTTSLTAPTAAYAQSQTGVVDRIDVQGNERIEAGTVLSYLPIQPGDTVDAAKLDVALKTLYRTDLFADVKIDLQNGALVVRVVENPIINQVVFEGNGSLKDDKLKDEVSVRPRGIFTKAKVQADVQRIIELYRRAGRISATVTPKVVELPQKRVDLIFEINEGPKSGVLDVNFLGNQAYSDNDLADVVVTKESHWYKFFSNNDNYDPDRIEYDKEQLRKFYRNKGYYDFRVVSAVAELAPDKNGFAITYTLDEGKKFKFGKLSVETELKKLDGTVLAQLLPIRTGQLYEDQKIEQATDALTFAAGAAGFAFVDVRPRYVPNRETNTVDVVFQVKEGPRVYVDRIDIVGNTRTLDYVIRRELEVSEGDAYNRVLVDRSKNQIRSLGFFKDVDISEVPSAQPDRTSLRVKVEEQPTGELSFSAGYSSVDKLVLDLGVSERNFRGRGQNLRARISVGSLRQQIDFSFTEPRFLGRDLRAGVDIYSYKYDFSRQTAFNTASTGGNLRLGFPLTNATSMSLTYTLRQDEVTVDSSYCIPGQEIVSPILCEQRGARITSMLGYGLRMDRRNDPINPTRGFYVDLEQALAGVGGDTNYLKTEVDGGWYHGFNKDFILSLTGGFGYIDGWRGDTVRINDRFYRGGNTFRGFEVAGIGPRDTTFGRGDALGAKFYALGSAELTIPTYLPEQYGIKASLFADVGTAGGLDKVDKEVRPGVVEQCLINPSNTSGPTRDCIQDDYALRATVGLSVFWKSPMGPIRFDFGQVLAKEDYDKTESFRFSTSTRF